MSLRYFARSASDKTDDWSIWFIADRDWGGLNVTSTVWDRLLPGTRTPGVVFLDKEGAISMAAMANDEAREKVICPSCGGLV